MTRALLLRLIAVLAVAAGYLTTTSAHAATAVPTCFGKPATIVGTADHDVITGTNGDDVIVAGDGPDVVHGRGGRDLICGGPGYYDDERRLSDQLYGGKGDDWLDGGVEGDELYGGAGNDVLRGRSGDDIVADGPGDDRVFGGSGSDTVFAGTGNDRMIGGPEDEPPLADTVHYNDYPSAVTVDLKAGIATSARGDDVLRHFGWVEGSRFDDILRGNAGENWIAGGCGDDVIDGRAGRDRFAGNDFWSEDLCDSSTSGDDDTIKGGSGADYVRGELSFYPGIDDVRGGPGDDMLASQGAREHFDGGPGIDEFSALDAAYPDGLTLDLDLAMGTYTIGDNSGTLAGVETVVGTGYDDTIRGNSGPNTLVGTSGDDRLYGRGGDDVLRGDYLDEEWDVYSDVADGGMGTDDCQAETVTNCEPA